MQLNQYKRLAISGNTKVYSTAAAELKSILGDALTITADHSDADIIVSQWHHLPQRKMLIELGRSTLHTITPHRDTFEITAHQGRLYLLGTTGRAMLQAVYTFADIINQHDDIPDDYHQIGVFHFQQRIFHQRFNNWPGSRDDIHFLSRMGASHCLITHDWQGDLRHFHGYVSSDIFPHALDHDTVQHQHNQLRTLLDNITDVGLEAAIWLTELPCQGGPWIPQPQRDAFLQRFPQDVLSPSGTYQGQVLCFSHPLVQDFYADTISRFFQAFPEISLIFLFGLDAGGEFCDPDSCPRCRGLTKFAQRDRLIRFLIEKGQAAQPSLRVLTTGWQWERINPTEFLSRQKALPSASGLFLAAQCDGWQVERQNHHALAAARETCRQQKQTFIGYDNFHWGDDTVHGLRDIQDFPLGIAAKLKRWAILQTDGIFDHWGTQYEDIWSNSIACREFMLNPFADPQKLCQEIAVKQFGTQAGPAVYHAWLQLEQAHTILSNHCHWSPWQWFGWYHGKEHPPFAKHFENQRKLLLEHFEPAKNAPGYHYNPDSLIERLQGVSTSWQQAYPFYQNAHHHLNHALTLATNQPVGCAYWYKDRTKTPSAQEHIARQQVYVLSMALTGREIGLHFALHARYEQLNRNENDYIHQCTQLLQADADACDAVADYFDQLTNDKRFVLDHFASPQPYRAKAQTIRNHLKYHGEITVNLFL